MCLQLEIHQLYHFLYTYYLTAAMYGLKWGDSSTQSVHHSPFFSSLFLWDIFLVLQYLDRIGQLFFGVPPKQSPSYGGLLGEWSRTCIQSFIHCVCCGYAILCPLCKPSCKFCANIDMCYKSYSQVKVLFSKM